MKLLLVEDEKAMAEALKEILQKNNYSVDTCYDGEEGRDFALTALYDVIILDINLPKMDGITVLREIRTSDIGTPVILLTARDATKDKVDGLDSGADDYLTKPFKSDELLARIRALTRRNKEAVPNSNLIYGDIELNPHTLMLSTPSKSFQLTLKESQLMELLIANRNISVSKNTVIEKLWGYDSDAEDHNVEVYISFLRKKLKAADSKAIINTVRGVGYSLTTSDKEGSYHVQKASE
ncbi:response regulator transcription factor [Pygmaiobacter massiliensis]|uniref:response regulator transcription factor n=1 Tax=Pygmaiobacter massiliensis TaxID=1917873 RepID=UPI00289EC4FD|nr:response regulator transcription factor [Pygmaiobacter massiliensis]